MERNNRDGYNFRDDEHIRRIVNFLYSDSDEDMDMDADMEGNRIDQEEAGQAGAAQAGPSHGWPDQAGAETTVEYQTRATQTDASYIAAGASCSLRHKSVTSGLLAFQAAHGGSSVAGPSRHRVAAEAPYPPPGARPILGRTGPTDSITGDKRYTFCKYCMPIQLAKGWMPADYGSHRTKTDDGRVICPDLRVRNVNRAMAGSRIPPVLNQPPDDSMQNYDEFERALHRYLDALEPSSSSNGTETTSEGNGTESSSENVSSLGSNGTASDRSDGKDFGPIGQNRRPQKE